jgi:hypothetical protein
MAEDPVPVLSRRKWLSLAPAVAAVGAAGLAQRLPAAVKAASPAPNRDLGTRTYNLRDYGALGDGVALDTAALQSAIDACSHDGGGIVLVPAGVFLIGAAELKNNVTLRICAGGKLLGSGRGIHYHPVDAIPLTGDSTLGDGNWALLYAVGAHHITVEGPGMIDGNGEQFRSPVKGQMAPSGLSSLKRPYHLLFYRCENITVRDIDLFQCAYHSVRIIQSRHIQLSGIHIFNRVNHNNDGFHFISAEHVAISDCEVEAQDDACALFGSCRFITVTNSYFSTRWSVFRFGGGTATMVTVTNCIFHQVFGCPIKLHGGPGSRFENMSFSNCVLDEVTGPIHISIGNYSHRAFADGSAAHAKLPTEAAKSAPPIVRNISFSQFRGTVTTHPPDLPMTEVKSTYAPGEKLSCIALNCAPGSDAILENISFSDIHLTFGGGGTAEAAARRELPALAGEYFALGPLPAYGFYARNARALTLSNLRFEVATPELRPAIFLDHVTDASITALSAQGHPAVELIRLIGVQDIWISAIRVLSPSGPLLQLEGTENRAITVDGGDASRAQSALALVGGAEPTSAKIRLSTS